MLMRYPGGKGKLAKAIIPRLESMIRAAGPDVEYREPFLGAGAIGLPLLEKNPHFRRAWINDSDPAAAAAWDCVLNRAKALKILVHAFSEVINADYFYFYKKILCTLSNPEDLGRYDLAVIGLMKIGIHQMSFSGLGTRAGGPMGGRGQGGRYGVGSRYNPSRICRTIDSCREILSRVQLRRGTCTCLDFELLFDPGDAVYYLDPPYFGAGPGLYQASFGPHDHVRLSELLRGESRRWLLSYDNHPAILDLYRDWTDIEEVSVAYSINGRAHDTELLISNRSNTRGNAMLAENLAEMHESPARQTELSPPPGAEPDETWSLDRLGRCASGGIAESVNLARRTTSEILRAGHALSIAKGKLDDRRGWGAWLKQHGIGRTAAWEAIKLHLGARSQPKIAELPITEAKVKLGIVSPRRSASGNPPRANAASAAPEVRTASASRDRSNEGPKAIEATAPKAGVGVAQVSEGGSRHDSPAEIGRGGGGDPVPSDGTPKHAVAEEPTNTECAGTCVTNGEVDANDGELRPFRETWADDEEVKFAGRPITRLVLEHLAVLWEPEAEEEEIEAGAGVNRETIFRVKGRELDQVNIGALDRLAAWLAGRHDSPRCGATATADGERGI